MKYYIHCNTDQAYAALTNNSITSYINTPESLRRKTLSFLTDDFIFLSQSVLPLDVRAIETDSIYYPITLEVEIPADSNIPAYLVNNDEAYTLSTERTNLASTESAVGAFVCGEIPIGYLSGIIFDNEENKERFRKPSPDLWFPEDLYKIAEANESEEVTRLTLENVVSLSAQVDALLSDDEKALVRSIVTKRLRYKAALYFALRETNDWRMGDVRTNVDRFVMSTLDAGNEDKPLTTLYANYLESKRAEDPRLPSFDAITEDDAILLGAPNTLDYKLFEITARQFVDMPCNVTRIGREFISEIRDAILSTQLSDSEVAETEMILSTIEEFLTSSVMNPEKALAKLGSHSTAKAIMKFLDSSDNDEFMRCGCEDLNQYEVRYAYILFGLLKGMSGVDRSTKENRSLNARITALAMQKFQSDLVISDSVDLTNSEATSVYGIIPFASYYMGKESSIKYLADSEHVSALTELYYFLAKQKPAIFKESLECFEAPCVISISCANSVLQQIPCKSTDDLAKVLKDKKLLTNLDKMIPRKVMLDVFLKKYIMNDRWYSEIFEKYNDVIQSICRG